MTEVLHDPKVKGLHRRVTATGARWYLYYRTKDGKERRPKLGDYPTLSVEGARRAAKDVLEQVAAGRDPSAKWQEDRGGMTVADLCQLYIERHLPKKKSGQNDRWIIGKHVIPKLGRVRLNDLKLHHVEDLHARISLTAPTQANRVLALLSKMLNLAEKWELRPRHSNPCGDVERNREGKRERYATDLEYEFVFEAMRQLRNRYPDVMSVIELLILTGARRNEIAGQKLQLIGNTLYLSDSKTGAKTILLPDAAVRLIRERGLEGRQLPSGSHVTHVWKKVRERAGVPDLRIHDLRHSFASIGLSNGATLDQIGKLLGHASTQTTSRYAHLQREVGHAIANSVAERIVGAMGEDRGRSSGHEDREPDLRGGLLLDRLSTDPGACGVPTLSE